jgi:Amino acid permease
MLSLSHFKERRGSRTLEGRSHVPPSPACAAPKSQRLVKAKTPVADASFLFMGSTGALLVSAGAVISMIGNNMGGMLGRSRILFALAENGELPRFLRAIHPRYHTPSNAIIFTAAVALSLALGWQSPALSRTSRPTWPSARPRSDRAQRHHQSGARRMFLEVPVRRVDRLPDSVQAMSVNFHEGPKRMAPKRVRPPTALRVAICRVGRSGDQDNPLGLGDFFAVLAEVVGAATV